MEFGLKGTSRLVADVTGSRHSGLGFTVFWLFTAVYSTARPPAPTEAHGCEQLAQRCYPAMRRPGVEPTIS